MFSLTQASNYVALLGFLLGIFQVNIATEELSKFVEAVMVIGGLVSSWYGRYRIGDLTKFGARKVVGVH